MLKVKRYIKEYANAINQDFAPCEVHVKTYIQRKIAKIIWAVSDGFLQDFDAMRELARITAEGYEEAMENADFTEEIPLF